MKLATAGVATVRPRREHASLELLRVHPRCAAAARDLRVVVEARERRVLGGLVDVERVPHLADRLDDVRRADAVADAQPGEPVDLREGAKDEDARPQVEVLLDAVRVVRLLDVLEVRLVEDGQDVVRDALEEAVRPRRADHRPGRVVGVAEVDELRPRPTSSRIRSTS